MSFNSVLITGSSRGIGRCLAMTFAKKGYPVILHGRNMDYLKKVEEEIRKDNGKAFSVAGDLREEKTLEEIYMTTRRNGISVLVNNAAVTCPGLPLEKLSYEKIQEMIEINLHAPIKLTKRLYDLLEEYHGTIININSLSGIENQKFRSLYCATKWGLRGFTDTLRLECSEKNIRIMGVYLSKIKNNQTDLVGLDLEKVCEEIYTSYKNENIDELIIDGRPKQYRIKKKIRTKRIFTNS